MRSHPSLQPLPLTHLLLRIDKKPWKQLLPRLSLYSVVSITELLLLLQLIELSFFSPHHTKLTKSFIS